MHGIMCIYPICSCLHSQCLSHNSWLTYTPHNTPDGRAVSEYKDCKAVPSIETLLILFPWATNNACVVVELGKGKCRCVKIFIAIKKCIWSKFTENHHRINSGRDDATCILS